MAQSAVIASLRSWTVQVILAVLLGFGVDALFESGLKWDEIHGSPFGVIGIQIVIPASIAVVCFGVGACVSATVPWLTRSGRWVFLPFVALFVGILVSDLSLGWRYALGSCCYWAHPGQDEPSLVIIFITYPTIATLFYSLGSYCMLRIKKPPKPARLPDEPAITSLGLSRR